MNVLNLIKSKTVKNYWKEIGYTPGPLQIAYIIDSFTGDDYTVEEIHKELLSITKKYGDPFIKKGRFEDNKDINMYLSDIIKNKVRIEKDLIKRFYAEESEMVYTGWLSLVNEAEAFELPEFDTFEEIKDYCSEYEFNRAYIMKRFPEEIDIELIFNSEFTLNAVSAISGTPEEGNAISMLYGIDCSMPSPFSVGDKVRLHDIEGPFEITSMDSMECGLIKLKAQYTSDDFIYHTFDIEAWDKKTIKE